MKLKLYISIILLVLTVQVFAQKPKHYLELAEQSQAIEDYTGASYYYLKAYELDSANLNVYLNYAHATLKDNNYKRAEFAFEYFYFHPLRETNDEALFFLALSQQFNGRYLQAKKNISDFIKYAAIEDPLLPKAKQVLKSCEFALENEENPRYFEVEHLDRSINTIHSEISPILLEDSLINFSTLIYQDFDYSNRLAEETDQKGIRLQKAVVSSKQKPQLIDSLFQEKYFHVANYSPLWDNKNLVTLCETSNSCAIFISTNDDDSITSIEKLPEIINSKNAVNTQPRIAFIDADTFLLFASNRDGGIGELDIWASKYSSNSFSKPENLGQRVNTPGNEITPYFLADSNALFFSSDWHEGYGGFDVFKVKGNIKNHSFPENLGSTINTSVNDLYFNYSKEKPYGTFVSNRKGSFSVKGETCCNDIYFFKHHEEILQDTVEQTDSLVEIELAGNIATKNTSINQITPKPNFDISKIAMVFFPNDIPKPGKNQLTSSMNYEEIHKLYLSQKTEYTAFDSTLDFFDIQLNQSFENVNSLKSYIDELKNSVDTLQITFQGFSSPLASKGYNKNLAARRIDAIKTYLNLEKPSTNLKIKSLALGERENMASYLSEATNSKAVYSKEAMLERRVNIQVEIKKAKK